MGPPLTLLDAYALIAFLAAERAGKLVRQLIVDGSTGIATTNLIEAIYVLERKHGIDADKVRAGVAELQAGDFTIVPIEERHAWRAAELRIAHYHRARGPVSLADCAMIAAADRGDAIATADPHVLAVAAAEGIEAIRLPGRI